MERASGNFKDENAVYYEDFGAVGDGVADDFAAMKAAHEYANKTAKTVYGKSGKTYLVRDTRDSEGKAQYIPIRTNVDWQGATIVIDDTELRADLSSPFSQHLKHIFVVESDYPKISAGAEILEKYKGGIKREGFSSLELGIDYPAMAIIYDKTHNNYIRYGMNHDSGQPQKDLVKLDASGKVMDNTPLMFDYNTVTDIEIIRTDVKGITLRNATVISKTSRVNNFTFDEESGTFKSRIIYFNRGILVQRSNTVIKDINHRITGELIYEDGEISDGKLVKMRIGGPAYSGMFTASQCDNIVIEGCVLTARRFYKIAGSYDFNATLVNNLTLKNCTQSNFYKDDGVTPSMAKAEFWGVGGTNLCKNMTYENCELTRYDAHCGVLNGKIIGCKLTAINLIGAGEFLIKDSLLELTGTDIICLRPDYGGTFRGTITIDNLTVKNYGDVFVTLSPFTNHYFGYTTYMPNLSVKRINLLNPGKIGLVRSYAPRYTISDGQSCGVCHEPCANKPVLSDGTKNNNPVVTAEYYEVTDYQNEYTLYDTPVFSTVKLIGNIKKTELTD